MENKHNKVTQKKIIEQNEEINYLKSKLYELAKTNKNLEKELEYANRRIETLESNNKNRKHDQKTYEKWHKVENKRSRKNHGNTLRNKLKNNKLKNNERNWVSKPRYQTTEPLTRKTPQRTYEKWQTVENKNSRKNRTNTLKHHKVNQVNESRNHKAARVSKPRDQILKTHNTFTKQTPQRSTNEANKSKISYPIRHTYTKRNPYMELRRDNELRMENDH